MKRLMLALAAMIAVAMMASAQKAELQLSYGGYTQMDATNCSGGVPTDNAWGAVTAGVNFNVVPNLWVGPSYTFSSQSFKPGGGNAYYHVFMLNGRYNYYRNSIVTLYAKLGIGGMASCMSPDAGDSWSKGHFAYQVTPVGAQVSINRSVAMFGELGFGAQGLLQVGFKFGI